ncbi:MAG: alpha/beta hydrolase family protein [Puniceicoccaceae bacterium]
MEKPIYNNRGESLDYIWQPGSPGHRQKDVLVLLGHEVTGNKDRPVIVDTATALQAAGFDTLRFSFSGNGGSGGRFVDSTISKEVDDLGSILDAVARDDQQVVYIGHSMGAAVGVLKTASDDRIHYLVSLAGMVDTKAFAETEFGEEVPDKGLMWEEPDCPLSRAFMDDLCKIVVNVLSQAKSVSVPWLLVHGSADDVVLPADSTAVQAAKGDAVTLVTINGADHSFNDPVHKRLQIRTVVDWLATQLP